VLGKLLLGLIAATAIAVPALLHPDLIAPYRWLYAGLTELLALAMLVCAAPLFRTAFGRTPPPPPTTPHRTLPLPVRPEKTLVRLHRVGITQAAGVPVCLSFSPDTVLVGLRSADELLLSRREMSLAPAARFFRSKVELVPLLPIGINRELSEYTLCGDGAFVMDVCTQLIQLDVPSSRIHVEILTPAPELPGGHPSAPFVDPGATSEYLPIRGRPSETRLRAGGPTNRKEMSVR